jgi:hypothetical protein
MTIEEPSSVPKYRVASDRLWEETNLAYGGSFRGIYRLHVLDEQSAFLPLPRLLGVDAQGILYIGASDNVPGRLGELRKSVNAAYWQVDAKTYAHLPFRDVTPHPTGMKIVRIPRFVERFRFERLCVTMERCTVAPEALDADVKDYEYKLEARLLQAYEKQYGEKPALNG